MFEKLLGQNGIGGDLTHHDHLEPAAAVGGLARTSSQSEAGQQVDDLGRLADGAHEGNHQLDIGQAHVFAYPAHRPALHLEALGKVC